MLSFREDTVLFHLVQVNITFTMAIMKNLMENKELLLMLRQSQTFSLMAIMAAIRFPIHRKTRLIMMATVL